MASRGLFRQLRIFLMLLVLFGVAMSTWLDRVRTTSWERSLWMAVYPVNGDGSAVTRSYIDGLRDADFADIGAYLAGQARRYGVAVAEPVSVHLAAQVQARPPMPPAGGGTLSIMLWSLKLRYWAFTHDDYDGPTPDIRMFVVYHDPQHAARLQHSLGLQKGLVGVVNAFASPAMAARNNVVIAHEFLHTVGASDKYDPSDNLPLYPQGYAEPDRDPRLPQRLAEIMAGRIPLSEQRAVMPQSLSETVVGPGTALEIRWLR